MSWGGLRAAGFVPAVAALLLAALPSALPAFSGALEVGSWNPSYRGSVVINGSRDESFDFQDDLELHARSRPIFALRIGADGAWWLPELLAAHTNLRADGDATRDSGVTVGNIVLLPGSVRRETTIDVDDSHISLRWPIALGDGALRISPGVTYRILSGDLAISENGVLLTLQQDAEVSERFPMAHLGLDWTLGPMHAAVAGNWAEAGGDRVYDFNAQLWLQPSWSGAVRAGVGWQLRRYDFDNGNTVVDARLAGAQFLVGLNW